MSSHCVHSSHQVSWSLVPAAGRGGMSCANAPILSRKAVATWRTCFLSLCSSCPKECKGKVLPSKTHMVGWEPENGGTSMLAICRRYWTCLFGADNRGATPRTRGDTIFWRCCHARYKSPFNKLKLFGKGSTRTLRITPQRRPPASRLTSPVRVAPPRSSVSLHQTRSQSPVPIGSQRSAPRPTKHTATATTTARLTKKRLTRGKTRATTC